MKALSVVQKAGKLISSGEKTLEIRKWKLDELPLVNLAIVQNKRRLTKEDPIDPNGSVVAVVDVTHIRKWTPEDAEETCSEWEEGWLAWELKNVRKVTSPLAAPAKRKIYEIECNLEDLLIVESGEQNLANPRPRASAAVLRNEGTEILMVKHLQRDGSSYWQLPGGGLSKNESLAEAAARELTEETGLMGNVLRELFTIPYKHGLSTTCACLQDILLVIYDPLN